MTEVAMPGRRAYWSKYALDSSEDSESAFVPGVSAPGNRRPLKLLARKTPEIKVRIPITQPVVEQLAVSIDTDMSLEEDIQKKPRPSQFKIPTSSGVKATERVKVKETHRIKPGFHDNKQKSVSLKDLPLEEKKRIANLIKELARVGDEKEKAIDQLHTERDQFERQVLQLVDQQEKILNEREVIQNQLFQCQDLLTKYQEKIEQKQQEVVDLITTPSKENDIPSIPGVQKDKKPRSRSRSPETSLPYTSHCHGRDLRSSHDKLYTSLIDKAIANQRSGVGEDGLSSIGGQSEVGSVKGQTPPRLHLPNQVPLALRNPVMSSTQKSADIKVFNSEEGSFHSLQPDPSPRSSRMSNELVLDNENNRDFSQKSKVGFKEKLEEDFDKVHSPNINPSGVFGDKSYMSYYKKLSQTDRKRELLRQREKLLDEQRRLKDILRSQEAQIKTRQNLIEQQRDLQQDRMEFFEKNGKFPLGRDLGVPEDTKENVPPPPPISMPLPQGQTQGDDDGSLFNYGVKKLNFDTEGEEVPDEAMKTPPNARQRNQQSMATSPIRMMSPSDRATSSPHRVDAATSVSHINISPRTQKHNESVEDLLLGQQLGNLPLPHSPATRGSPGLQSSFQNNLPLQSNRGRSNQSPVSKPTAGNKTLSVIEILNTMEKSPSWSGSVRSHRNSPGLSGGVHRNKNSPRQNLQRDSPAYNTPQKSEALYDEDGDEEESQILEDVFFLK